MIYRVLCLITLLACSSLTPNLAQASFKKDSLDFTQTIQSLIEDQIVAFLAEDADLAYQYATKSVRERFTTPKHFLRMVKSKYKPVYAPKYYNFGPSTISKKEAYQTVFFVDQDNKEWVALFTLSHDKKDAAWRIESCRLRPNKSTPNI